MRGQSPAYAPFSAVRRCNINVSFKVVDETATKNATITPSEQLLPNDVKEIIENETEFIPKYAFLEHNIWALDGTNIIMPKDTSDQKLGWWTTQLSNANGEFDSPPYLEITFNGNAVSTIGFTMNFNETHGQFPTLIRLITYGADGAVIDDATLENNSAISVLPFSSVGYYKLRIEFLKSNLPYNRVRLLNLVFGVTKKYDKTNIVDAVIIEAVGFASESLPSSEMVITVDNSNREYDLLAPQNIFAYLQEGQKVSTNVEINDEHIYMGEMYYQEAKASDGGATAQITFSDRIRMLDNVAFNDGMDGTDSLSNVVSLVLNGTGIVPKYGADIAATTVSKALPLGTTKREALRLLAQAACCTCWINRDGELEFNRLLVADEPVQTLTGDELLNYNGVSISEKVDAVILSVENQFTGTNTQYFAGDGTLVKTISNPCVYNGQSVADWLLSCYNRRRRYDVQNRGDPALEIGDTITIYDAYGQNLKSVQTRSELRYNGGIEIITQSVGE